jgi:aspartate kinase
MKILVQKFGGSSVSCCEKREQAIQKIIDAQQKGYKVAVVISAMGRYPDPYATDSLVKLIKNDEEQNICTRDMDLLMSCGEVISCVVMAQQLRDKGYKAVAVTGWQAGIVTDNHFSESRIHKIYPDYVLAKIEDGYIPIIAGFQGITKDGEITTLGRGGSDTSATAIGVALNADAIEIYTDVDGIMTADPRILDNPRTIPEMHYTEAGEMAGEGAKVLHKRCIAPAFRAGIPTWVKSTLSDHPGTCINAKEEEPFEEHRIVTSIVVVPDMAQIEMDLIDAYDRSQMRLEILKSMRDAGISIDQINVVREKFYFIVKENQVIDVVGVSKFLDIPIKITHDCAKISCVGIGMKGLPGVMARIQGSLADIGVNMLHATDSHITISCLVKSVDIERTVKALADQFKLRG